ncbi:MAG: hypothetical protein AB7P34_00955 [Vicinamibacterales bacterium]
MKTHHLCLALVAGLLLTTPAWADDTIVAPYGARAWRSVSFGEPPATEPAPAPAPRFAVPAVIAPDAEQRPVAVTHSKAFEVRSKIHKLASYATMPLFVAQYIVGQKLYDGTGSESAKSAHGALVVGMAGLFAVNSVTGVWNLWEERHESKGRAKRWIHGLMMLGAGAGFVATGATAPDDDDDGGGTSSNRSLHRNLAIGSMGVSAASYLFMFFTR